jgi:transmembrane sensor
MTIASIQPGAGARAEQAAIWAARLADGQVPPEQRAEFQAWLDADPGNAAALEEIIGAWQAVEHYAASGQMMALREAALASARRTMHSRAITLPRRAMIWTAIAATLVLAIGGAGVWTWLTPRTYETGVGERRVVALSDGSKVSLDAATVVRVRFTGAERRLWLTQGRAKFDVAKNPLRPFSVQAADDVVVATGTAFSVEMVQNQVHVVLYEGHVALLQRGDDGVRRTVSLGPALAPADRLLTPGREVILAQTPAPQSALAATQVERADPVRSLSWEAGLLVFDDEKLGVAVERMNRYAEKPLIIGDAAAAEVRISGVFRAGDTDALVQGLAAAFDVKSRVGPQGVTLFKAPGRPPAV